MANIAIKYKQLTGIHENLTIDNGQTFAQLRTVIISNDDGNISSGVYGPVSINKNGTLFDSTTHASTTLATAGVVAGDLITCATARQSTKQAYQEATIEIASFKRQGGLAEDTDANYYRTRNIGTTLRLQARFVGNNNTDNTGSHLGDAHPHIVGRPFRAS